MPIKQCIILDLKLYTDALYKLSFNQKIKFLKDFEREQQRVRPFKMETDWIF